MEEFPNKYNTIALVKMKPQLLKSFFIVKIQQILVSIHLELI